MVQLDVYHGITIELRRKYGLKIGRFNCIEGSRTNKDLLDSTSCLPKVEQKDFVQATFFVGAKDLLQSIQTPRSLILDSRRS